MASLLETFFIMFESNADKLKRGEDDARKSTKDLENDLSNTDHAGAAMGEHLVGTLKEVALGFAAAFGAHEIIDRVMETAELNDMLGKTARSLDVNISELDAYDQAAQRAGGTVGGFQASLGSLVRGMAAADATGHSRLLPFFKEMGISMLDTHGKARPVMELLPELADAFEKMGHQRSTGFAEKLGLDQGTMMLLQSGRRSVEDLVARQRALGTVTEEDAVKAEKFNDQWMDTQQIFRNVFTAIGSAVLPVLTALLKGFEGVFGYLAQHRSLVEGFFIGLATIVTTVYGPAMVEAAVATLAAVWPFVLMAVAIGTLIAAFTFLYDDIKNFLAGNASVIGELSRKWPWIGELIKTVVKDIGAVVEWFSGVLSAFGDLAGAVGELIAAVFGAAFRVLERGFKSASDLISGFIKNFPAVGAAVKVLGGIFTAIGGAIGKVWDWIYDKVKRAVDFIQGAAGLVRRIAKWFGFGGGDDSPKPPVTPRPNSEAALAAAHAAIHAANSTSPLLAHRPTTLNKTVTSTVETINIYPPNGDAGSIGGAVGDHIEKHLRHATDHFDDGVQG